MLFKSRNRKGSWNSAVKLLWFHFPGGEHLMWTRAIQYGSWNFFTLIFAKRTTVQKTMIGLVFRQYQANKTNNTLFKSKQNCSRVRNFNGVKRKQNVHATIKVKTGNNERNVTVGNNVSTVKEPDRWGSWYPPSAFGYVIEIWLWYRSIEERTYFWLKRPHQPSTPPNCWSFQSSSANSKRNIVCLQR